MKAFIKDSLFCMVASAVIAATLEFWPKSIPDGIPFSLQSPFLGWFINFLVLFVMTNVPVAFFRFASTELNVRPWIRRMYAAALTLPLIGGGFFLEFGRFDEVYISDDSVHLRGPSFLANEDFKLKHVQLVYLRGSSNIKELVFLWYDRAIQSCYIGAFDPQSSKNLQEMIELFANRGIDVHSTKPERHRRLKPFRPWN